MAKKKKKAVKKSVKKMSQDQMAVRGQTMRDLLNRGMPGAVSSEPMIQPQMPMMQ